MPVPLSFISREAGNLLCSGFVNLICSQLNGQVQTAVHQHQHQQQQHQHHHHHHHHHHHNDDCIYYDHDHDHDYHNDVHKNVAVLFAVVPDTSLAVYRRIVEPENLKIGVTAHIGGFMAGKRVFLCIVCSALCVCLCVHFTVNSAACSCMLDIYLVQLHYVETV